MAYTPTLWAKGDIVTSEKLNKIEQGIVDKVDKVNGKTLSTNDYTNEDKAKLNGLESQIDHLESLVGSPLVASTAAEMTDEDKVYVYTGSETGYQSGNWYYYNGTAWVSGGVYNSVAFETDDTLSIQGMPADAKKTGDELLDLKEDLENIGYNKVNIVSWDSSFFVNSSGAKGTASGFGNSGPIAVKKGEHIKAYVKGLSTNVALLSFATTETPTTFTPVIVSENSNAVWIDYKFINDGYAFVSSNINSVSPVVYKYININDVYSGVIKNENNIVTINHIYVAADGDDETGDGSVGNPYATIYHANETITDNDEKNRYIIHVGDGTYTDLQTKYSGIGYTDQATYQGIICKNYVEYIGNIKNPSECVISWDGATGLTNPSYHDVILKCPFHIRGGGIHGVGIHTRVSGFKIVGKNLRYAMHIDTGGQGDNVVWEVSDCIFNWFGVPDVSDYSSNANVACIGTGSSNFEKGHLLRVAIMNETGLTIGYQNHDNIRNSYYNDAPAFFEGAEITIEACNFSAGDQKTSIKMRNIYSGDVTQGYDRINIIDCIGIASLELSALSGVTLKWKAKIECSDIDTQIGVN